MGMLVKGRWTDEDRSIENGAYVRRASVFGDGLGPDFAAAVRSTPGRFHLIASLSCPWSHRTMLVRRLKRLEQAIPLQIAGGRRIEGYPANGGEPWAVPGTDRRITHLHELYALGEPAYTGRVTVPVLWDSATRTIVSNESAVIMRALDEVPGPADSDFTLRPAISADEIVALNTQVYEGLSNAVYRAGFAECQAAYDEAVAQVFDTLDRLESRLIGGRYLLGRTITEADWRLFPTLVRFDAAYHTHFRCTRRRLVDYPNLWAYARDLYAWAGIAETVDFDAIRAGYYLNDGAHNPHGIVAAQPDADWLEPHGRAALGPAQVALCGGGVGEIVPDTLDIKRG